MAEQQQPQPQREIKMGPVDLALYGFILCIHYPLKLTVATYKTSKAAIVKTVSLPKRILGYTFETAATLKHNAEKRISNTLSYARNTASTSVDATKNTITSTKDYTTNTTSNTINLARGAFVSTIDLARNTTTAAINTALYVPRKTVSAIKSTTTATTNLAKNTVSTGISCTRNSILYVGSLFSQAKTEANHQFETKINEPKLQYEKALSETANSITDYTLTKANAVKKDAEGIVKRGTNFVRNVTFLGFDFLKQLTEDINLNEQNDLKAAEPTNQFEKALQRFQAAAFETERQTLKAEITKLHEELKRNQQQNNPTFDKERLKCDKQIHDLQDQLTRIHLTYTQQKQHLIGEFEKECQQYKQEIQKLTHQLLQTQISYEQLNKQQVTGFDKERHQYQEEIQKLLQKVAKLKQDLSKHKDTNHSDDIPDEDDTHSEDPYVTEVFQKIDAVKKAAHDLKKKVAEFIGTEKDEAYLKINEQIIRHLIKLHNIESKGYNIIRKKRKEALRFVQKIQDELKSKI
ncbi:hypothetical protein ILUMI_27385 [Ignelater luminosus]|uniref:BAG domain-containing protein n=1 Tax=Ignelater luminosus TaxID=2038154 RepID=A0A8K0C565_IGNLU|nr:hypothetical protein ILUMI_27385 [Ignelater luminosus]